MTLPGPDAVVVRDAEAEVVRMLGGRGRLLADADATEGALSTMRVTLERGADGATPHYHGGSSELFFVISGRAQVLTGERVVTAGPGDLVVVPPHLPHAFAAAPDSPVDLLIVIAPGVERFEYFRLLERVGRGEASVEDVLAAQDRFDNHFLDSTAWQTARAAARQEAGDEVRDESGKSARGDAGPAAGDAPAG
ncbi:cupin domain-containing protein [Streptomyces sp. NPDC086023]|uniref:cupin domain-containing protein n=1 Tax=Streptomyces sp. NPDC086023 TaxID=3365746 RepID=UPI0037D2687C